MKDLLAKIENLDSIIESTIDMKKPNDTIEIYHGVFILKNETVEVMLNGKIYFNWFPSLYVIFIGETDMLENNDNLFEKTKSLDLIIHDLKFSEAYITNVQISDKISIRGISTNDTVLGDKSIKINKIKFSVPNFIDFMGSPVKKTSGNTTSIVSNRLIFENEKYKITIDKAVNYKELKESLDEFGGYIFLYNGELIKKKGAIDYNEAKEILHCFGIFLSFLNGRKTAAMFPQGIFESEVIWKDFSVPHVDIYKYSTSWPNLNSTSGLNEVWGKFCEMWENPVDKDFLLFAIHWYMQCNKNSDFVESSLIMAQTALELIYNWYIVENKKLIIGNDSANINASNKIRLLISQLNLNYDTPIKYTALKEFIDTEKLIDAPEAIVQIRNAIIHSQEEKRKKLRNIKLMAQYQAVQLCISYIELSLLKILEFNHTYYNRNNTNLSKMNRVENVPWLK